MSTTAAEPVRPAVTPDPSITGVPFSRLVKVELRKVTDTRAGFWLLVAIGVITTAVVVIFMFAASSPQELTYLNFVYATTVPQGLLLPVMAILAVTAEWSQRTGLVTFTLEPNRLRLASAKLLAVTILGLLFVALALVAAAIANVLGQALRDGAGTWDLTAGLVGEMVLLQLVTLVQGFAFGLLLMNSATAIVAYFVVPIVWNVIFSLVSWLEDIAPWVDLGTATLPLMSDDGMGGENWAQLAVATGIWVLLPLVLGTIRLHRTEVKSA
jgi:ABC-2 type transport system permease protein